MFTGIVQGIGEVESVEGDGESADLSLRLPAGLGSLQAGESLAIDGACLTAEFNTSTQFRASVSWETLARTTLSSKRPGDKVNLERSLRPSDRMGGHFVTGHIDGMGRVRSLELRGQSWELSVEAPAEILQFCIEKGSIAIDGISLTLASVDQTGFTCAIIPHTYQSTTLQFRRSGDAVNLEGDLIGKYVFRFTQQGKATKPAGLSWEQLENAGFV